MPRLVKLPTSKLRAVIVREQRVRKMVLCRLQTQYRIGGRSISERSQIPLQKRVFQRLGVVLVIAELFSVGAPAVQAQPIRTYPASVVFQGDVFDCGPAALATLLQLRLRRSATLSELAEALPVLSREEWRRIRTHGYSLGQLVAMTAELGARATLSRLTARGLAQISLPVLVYLDLPTGPHYSVLTGMVGSQVALADPSQGAVVWPKAQFFSAWSTTGGGYVLSITADPVG